MSHTPDSSDGSSDGLESSTLMGRRPAIDRYGSDGVHATRHLPFIGQPASMNPGSIFNVEGLVAVITGGGTGIGLMMAQALEQNGATVYIIGRRAQVVETAAKEHSKFGKIHAIVGDITDRTDLLAIVEKIKAQHGFIDLLVNNAGIARNLYPHPLPSPSDQPPLATSGSKAASNPPLSPPASPGPVNGKALHSKAEAAGGGHTGIPSIQAFQNTLWECGSPEDFAAVFATNVTAPYYTTIAFLDLLHQGNIRRQRFAASSMRSKKNRTSVGSFSSSDSEDGVGEEQDEEPVLMFPSLPYQTSQVLTVSSSGSFRIDGRVLSPSYTLSKAAETHLGKMLANLLGPWGIRSNVLAPGVWPTEMTTNPTPDFKLDPAMLASTVPLKRTGTPEDIAGTILFLASAAGAYVNGAVWLVDGGRVGTVASTYSQ